MQNKSNHSQNSPAAAGASKAQAAARGKTSKISPRSRDGSPNNPQHTADPRRLAHSILLACEERGQYSNLALDAAIKKNNLTDADRALLTRLVFGVIERRVTLDWYADMLSADGIAKIEPAVLTALRLGLYQLIYSDKIPAHAAVNESVSLVPRRAAGFVNAILRRFLRERENIALPDRESEFGEYLSVKYSFPEPLCRRFEEIFGRDSAERLLAAFVNTPRLTLRVNTHKINREDLLERLTAAGHNAEPSPLSPDGIIIASAPLRGLPGFDEGLFFVQDEASQLCVRALDALPGMTVADTCAAPGSKSFGVALTMKNEGILHSFDLHDNKISLIRSGAERLGISIIKTEGRDARTPDPTLVGACDRVLCDVPCSGLGVLAKKPEIRFKSLDYAAALPAIQFDILEKSSAYLKPGGILVYSTCTLLPEENEEVVSRFLASYPGFSLLPFTTGQLDVPGGMITLTPHIHGTDGFFIAKLKKFN